MLPVECNWCNATKGPSDWLPGAESQNLKRNDPSMISAFMIDRVYLRLSVLSLITDLLQQQQKIKIHARVKQNCLISSALALEIWSLIQIEKTQSTFNKKNDWLTYRFSCTYSKYRNLYFFVSCDQAALRTLLSVRPSFCQSGCPSHLFHYVRVIVSSWNFQELLPMTKTMSMQKVKVRG